MQWGGIKNGAVLKLIERGAFEVFLTGHKNMKNEQQLEGWHFAVLVVSAINWPVVRPIREFARSAGRRTKYLPLAVLLDENHTYVCFELTFQLPALSRTPETQDPKP